MAWKNVVLADDIGVQAELQRRAQAETDATVRRLQTVIRVMSFYKADKSSQVQALEEMSHTLSKLSAEQMNDVLRKLEAAARAPEGGFRAEVDAAHAKHREILDKLRTMMGRYDAAQGIEQIADRLAKCSRTQFDMYLVHSDPNLALVDRYIVEVPALTKREYLDQQRYGKKYQTKFLESSRLGDEQTDVQNEVLSLLDQIDEMQPLLTEAARRRVEALGSYAELRNVVGVLERSVERSQPDTAWERTVGGKVESFELPEPQVRRRARAVEAQAELAVHFAQMARLLRPPTDALPLLLDARHAIDEAINKQGEINEATKRLAEAEAKANEPNKEFEAEPKADAPKQPAKSPQQVAAEKAAEKAAKVRIAKVFHDLLKKEAAIHFVAHDLENALAIVAPDVAESLHDAHLEAKWGKQELVARDAKAALAPQAAVIVELSRARMRIDQRIGTLRKAKTDPLAALENAAQKLDALIVEQKRNRDTTDAIAQGPAQAGSFAAVTATQKDLLLKTADLKAQALPGKAKFAAALQTAAIEMKGAIKDLIRELAEPAVVGEEKALAALRDARKELGDTIAAVKKNRDDMARLEQAAEKLKQLAKREKNIANRAANAGPQDSFVLLVQEQGALTAPTSDLAEDIKDTVPLASAKIGASVDDMQKARAGFEKSNAKSASQDAAEAARKLVEAQKEIARALDAMKAKEMMDQAALQPKAVDPIGLAQNLAIALEQTEKAAQDAARADELAKKLGDLAGKQGQLAKDADALKLPDAAKAAAAAAEVLKKNDLSESLKSQQQALDKLEKAAKPKIEPKFEEKKDAKQSPPRAPNNSDGSKSSAPHAPTPGDSKALDTPPMPTAPTNLSPTPAPPLARAPMPELAAADLARLQKDLLKETDALAKSKEATDAALSALAQAQAQAPKAIEEQLQIAAQQLAKAAESLQSASAGDALISQNNAAAELSKALDTVNTYLGMAKATPSDLKAEPTPPEPGIDEAGKGDPTKQSASASKIPDQLSKDDKNESGGKGGITGDDSGKGAEKNSQRGKGDRNADGKTSHARSQLLDVEGEGIFTYLPPRQRDFIRQAVLANLPPEYAAEIQQYFINIARGRSATGN